MKRGVVRRILILVFAGLLCLSMLFYSKEAEKEAPASTGILTLWYAEPDLSPAVMDALLSRCREETGLLIKAERFADEAALAEAFETGRPDLLFCSHLRAAQIERGGGLAAISEPLPIPEALTEIHPTVGTFFFPIGLNMPLLLVNTTLMAARFDSLEDLLHSAGNEPFITSDDFSALLYSAMSAKGERMQGVPEADRNNKSYVALYNLLAEAAFRGGLVLTDGNAAEYVRQGLLPCAIVRSAALAGMEEPELAFLPVPLPEGAKTEYPAELMGFALPAGADMETAQRFAQWLWDGQGIGTALAAGLIPIALDGSESGAESELGQLLCSLCRQGAFRLPDAEEPFFKNHADCERKLREALDLLA